jgi:hypothetical protein
MSMRGIDFVLLQEQQQVLGDEVAPVLPVDTPEEPIRFELGLLAEYLPQELTLVLNLPDARHQLDQLLLGCVGEHVQ